MKYREKVELKHKLTEVYRKYHKPAYLKMDPLSIVHNFKRERNIEIAALISAVLAYGRFENIIQALESIFSITGINLQDFILASSFKKKYKLLDKFKYRFNDGTDIAILLECIGIAIKEYGSIGTLFLHGFTKNDLHIGDSLDRFTGFFKQNSLRLTGVLKKSFEYLFPSPISGSACKRLNIYLRWMIRPNDGIDFGLWHGIPASFLIMPVDTHVARIARQWNLTSRKTPNWRMAEEITNCLKVVDPDDPVRFDFSICRSGMYDYRKGFVCESKG